MAATNQTINFAVWNSSTKSTVKQLNHLTM